MNLRSSAIRERPGAALPRTPRLFFGWKVAIAGSVILGLQSALVLQAFGSYAVVLKEEFGWSTMVFSVAYAFNRAESGLLGPLHGWALSRFGSRRVMQAGAAFILGGFVWFSRIDTPFGFVASYFVVAVGASFAGFLTITTETVNWFSRKRSFALTISNIGVAAGGFLTPIVVILLDSLGWRTSAVLTGLAVAAVVLAVSGLFGQSLEDRGEPLDGIPPEALEAEAAAAGGVVRLRQVEISAREAMRTRAFWFLAFGHASALLVVSVVLAHLSLFLTSEQGYSLKEAGYVLAAIAPVQLLGMVVGGLLGDRFDKRWLCSAAMFGHVIGLLMLTFASSVVMIGAFVLLHGFAWGMRGPLMVAIRADYFGPRSLAQVQGYTSMILMFALVGGPMFAGVLADSTGSFEMGFTILAALASAGSVLFLLARPPQVPSAQSDDARAVACVAPVSP